MNLTFKEHKVLVRFFFIICIGVLIIWSLINRHKTKDNLSKRAVISVGVINNCYMLPKRGGAINVSFSFKTNANIITNDETVYGINEGYFKQFFVGRSFPVIYDTIDTKNSELLLTPDNFERYNIKFPDSLQWVKKYWVYDYRSL